MWDRALMTAARAVARLGSKSPDSAETAAAPSQLGPAPSIEPTLNAVGKAGSQADLLSERERLIQLAARTRSHQHRAAAREATLQCLRRGR